MDILQKTLESGLAKIPVVLLAPILRKKLLEQGVKITPRRAEILASQVLEGKKSLSLPGTRTDPVKIDFSDQDNEALLQRADELLKNDLSGIIAKVLEDMTPPILQNLKKRWPSERRWRMQQSNYFKQRLRGRWGRALSKYRMLIVLAQDFGSEVNAEARAASTSQNADLIDVLTRLHARSCQVAEEVLVLLENGFANGAMARWRTLHEISVAALFIERNGNECARRYKDHEIVESHRAAIDYETSRIRLGGPAIASADLESINANYSRVIKEYGKTFPGQYGWASVYLKTKQPAFKDLKDYVGNDFLRSHYRMASHGVHANPKGIFFSMGALFPSDVLQAGPSNSGLADAGDGAATALLKVSSTLLSLSQSVDYQITLKSMLLLRDEIGASFLAAHRKLYRDEKRLREEEKAARS